MLGIIFEKIHASIWACAALLVTNQFLRLLNKLMVIRASWSRPIIWWRNYIEIITLVPVSITVYVLIIRLSLSSRITIVLDIYIIIDIVRMCIAIVPTMSYLLMMLLDYHLIVILTTFSGIAISLFWSVMRAYIISNTCRHHIVSSMIGISICYKWQSSFLSITASLSGLRRSCHCNMTYLLLTITSIQVVV